MLNKVRRERESVGCCWGDMLPILQSSESQGSRELGCEWKDLHPIHNSMI